MATESFGISGNDSYSLDLALTPNSPEIVTGNPLTTADYAMSAPQLQQRESAPRTRGGGLLDRCVIIASGRARMPCPEYGRAGHRVDWQRTGRRHRP